MSQHFLLGPDTEKHRIFSSPDLRNSTIIGSNPTRKHTLQKKLVLHGEKLADNHCIIKPFIKSALIKTLTPGEITKLNGTPVKIKTLTTIRDGDVLQIGNVVYLYIIQSQPQRSQRQRSQPQRSQPQKPIKPVVNPERYLKALKKNSNYKPVHVNFRK